LSDDGALIKTHN